MTFEKKRLFLALLPVFSGILLSLTLPPYDFGFISFVALVPLFWFIVHTKSRAGVFWGGFCTGVLYVIKVLYPLAGLNAWWWTSPTGILWGLRSYLLVLFLTVVALYSGGIFVGSFSLLFKKFWRRSILDLFLFPSIWVLFELFREPLVLGFTWGHLGYALHNIPLLAQVAHLGLVYSLSFLIVAVNIGIFHLIEKMVAEKPKTPSQTLKTILRTKGFTLMVLFILASALYGLFNMHHIRETNQTVRVAAVHMDIKTEDSKSIPAFQAYLSLIDEAISIHPDIVVLPENAFPFFVIDQNTKLPLKYGNNGSTITELFDLLRERSLKNSNTSFIIGVHSADHGNIYNSSIVLENGSIKDIYDKRRLMPFAEDSSTIIERGTTKPLAAGQRQQSLSVHGFSVTPLICSEVIFPALSQDKNTNLIVNESNDSVFNSQLVGKQNQIIAKIRAIENKKYFIRSDKGGMTSIINPFGKILSQTQGKRAVIYADISL